MCATLALFFAYAFARIGVPIKTGPKQAVNDVDKLKAYVENETTFGYYICSENEIKFKHNVMQKPKVPPNAKSANEISDPSEPVQDTNNLPSCSSINTKKTSSNACQGQSEVSEFTSDYMSEIGHTQLCTGNETDDLTTTVVRSISEELTPHSRWENPIEKETELNHYHLIQKKPCQNQPHWQKQFRPQKELRAQMSKKAMHLC